MSPSTSEGFTVGSKVDPWTLFCLLLTLLMIEASIRADAGLTIINLLGAGGVHFTNVDCELTIGINFQLDRWLSCPRCLGSGGVGIGQRLWKRSVGSVLRSINRRSGHWRPRKSLAN